MGTTYKLKQEIKDFIIGQKKLNPKVSCRGLSSLIQEKFQLNLSKSLINNVIKQNNLSSPVGRTRIRAPKIAPEKPASPTMEEPAVKAEKPLIVSEVMGRDKEFIDNGGSFFLRAAEIKLGLTAQLAKYFSVYLPNLSIENLRLLLEALIFIPLFKYKRDLWLLLGKEIASESLAQYSQALAKLSLAELKEEFIKLGLNHNINEFKELQQKCLLQINAYAQNNFFPAAYKFLDLSTMQERFYCLQAKIEKVPQAIKIQLFYPAAFHWQKDIVWQEDIAYAIQRLNQAKIFTPENERLWLNPQPQGLAKNLAF